MSTAVAAFGALSPERVLEAVESGLRCRCTGLLRPLPSYINRVYTVESETGETVVAKFYRPGRWTREAVLAEHDFVLACAADEIPVIAPLPLAQGGTVGDADGIAFALYPRRGGRPIEPADPGNALWGRLGALLARVHRVGARAPAPARLTLHPLSATAEDLAYLLDGGFLEAREAARLDSFAAALFDRIVPQFEALGGEVIRLHGDCQHTNVLERPETGLFLIDFDDMMNGTPVQDLWMLLPGRAEECAAEWEQMIEGYETFRAFDRRTVRLIEPLRAMRMIYYLAWCARQAHDASFRQNHPDWGARAFWASELAELETQLGVIGEDAAGIG
ncbi:MAG: serine/threonine protein kinase [Kiritimatiellia bacterium]|jgi:Ser/Thr protein kinase RdoA (MazF antagonist)|nr:serine/threonine protein kinase [Kiritimatiellia bacterium]